jgi:hypothetical protein
MRTRLHQRLLLLLLLLLLLTPAPRALNAHH